MKKTDIEARLRGLDSLTPPPMDELLAGLDRSAASDGQAAPAAAPRRPAARRVIRTALTVGLAAVLCGALTIGAVAAVNENKEYRAALNYFTTNRLSTDGLSRSEIKETWRRFVTSGHDSEQPQPHTVEVRGGELLLCTEDEARDALTVQDTGGQPDAPGLSAASYEVLHDYESDTYFIVKYQVPYVADTIVWKRDVSPLEYVHTADAGDALYVYGYKDHQTVTLIRLDPDTGRELWRTDHRTKYTNILPMSVEPTDTGVVVFCRAAGDGARLSEKYRLVTLVLDQKGKVTETYESDLMGLFTINDAVRLGGGWCLRLRDLSGEPRPLPDKLVWMDDTYTVRHTYTLELGGADGAETDSMTIRDMLVSGDLVWLTASSLDIPLMDRELGQPVDENGLYYRRLCWPDDRIMDKVRNGTCAYLIAWDPVRGEVETFLSMPGCFFPAWYDSLSFREDGTPEWMAYSVVGVQPVSKYISSMRAFITCAVYECSCSPEGEVSAAYIGGTTIRW